MMTRDEFCPLWGAFALACTSYNMRNDSGTDRLEYQNKRGRSPQGEVWRGRGAKTQGNATFLKGGCGKLDRGSPMIPCRTLPASNTLRGEVPEQAEP